MRSKRAHTYTPTDKRTHGHPSTDYTVCPIPCRPTLIGQTVITACHHSGSGYLCRFVSVNDVRRQRRVIPTGLLVVVDDLRQSAWREHEASVCSDGPVQRRVVTVHGTWLRHRRSGRRSRRSLDTESQASKIIQRRTIGAPTYPR